MYKRTLYILTPILITVACLLCFQLLRPENRSVVSETDYARYLDASDRAFTDHLQQNRDRIDFWQRKLADEPQSGLYKLKLASILTERFKMTGEIAHLQRSDTLLQSALAGPLLKKAAAYHALSANAVTRHDFQAALRYAEMALQTNEAPAVSKLLIFDALMELGRSEEAEQTLTSVSNKSTFDYLIRRAKLEDHRGDLPQAILTMETAAGWCKRVDNRPLLCWTLSNLGDMYGHAGKVRQSYNTYLKVLEIDPAYHYALKGIAWIAYAHDGDIPQANRLARYLLKKQHSPDLYLFLAETADYEGRTVLAGQYRQKFIREATRPAYGRMYHKYLAEIKLNEPGAFQEAKPYVDMEIVNRPTAQSYALLAQYYNQAGQPEKSLDILQQHVEEKTYEPDVLMQVGLMFKAAGSNEKARKYLNEAAEAGLELGPLASREINLALQEL
jgi:tetratricopeptide (TPR) repeat protein